MPLRSRRNISVAVFGSVFFALGGVGVPALAIIQDVGIADTTEGACYLIAAFVFSVAVLAMGLNSAAFAGGMCCARIETSRLRSRVHIYSGVAGAITFVAVPFLFYAGQSICWLFDIYLPELMWGLVLVVLAPLVAFLLGCAVARLSVA